MKLQTSKFVSDVFRNLTSVSVELNYGTRRSDLKASATISVLETKLKSAEGDGETAFTSGSMRGQLREIWVKP